MFLGEMVGKFRDRDVETCGRGDTSFEDWIFVVVAQGDQVALERHVGKLESCNPLRRGDRGIPCPPETVGERLQVGDGGCLVETADAHVHRVDRSAAEDIEDVVADLLELEPALDEIAMVPSQVDRALVSEEIRRMKEIDVEDVALDPFAAVEQPAQSPHRVIDTNPADALDRLAGAHLICHRTDPANPRGDIGQLGV